jgi:hypothetical protein
MHIFLSAILLGFALTTAAADVVHMRSGDTLEGQVISLDRDRLQIRTGSDLVSVRRVDVSRIDLTPDQAPIADSGPFTLPTGMEIHVVLREALGVHQSRSGDEFEAALVQPLSSGGTTLAEEGSRVIGRVVRVERANGRGSEDKLHIELSEVPLLGKRTRIKTSLALPPDQAGLQSLARWNPVRLDVGTELRFALAQTVVLRPSRY